MCDFDGYFRFYLIDLECRFGLICFIIFFFDFNVFRNKRFFFEKERKGKERLEYEVLLCFGEMLWWRLFICVIIMV